MSLYHPYKKVSSTHPHHHAQTLLSNKNTKNKKSDSAGHNTGSSQSDYNLVAPIRQTASIFKQPVTVYKDHKSKVKAELKHVSREKPLQLFWTKRLAPLNINKQSSKEEVSEDDDEKEDEDATKVSKITLPSSIKSTGPGITNQMLLASISTHLHISKDPATGQTSETDSLDKNPSAFINPGQPLMCKMSVSDEEIRAQEIKVKEARQRLAKAIRSLR